MAVRTNWVTNPSFETNTAGWTVNGSAALTRVTSQFFTGIAAGQVVGSLANAGVQTNAATAGVGQTWSGSIALKTSTGATTGFTVDLRNQAGTVIQSVAVTLTSSWQVISVTGTTPAATTSVHIRVNRAAAAAHTYFVDTALLEQAPPGGAWFSGATTDTLIVTYAWTGTAHASTSTATDNSAIAVTAYQTADPSPRVEIVLSSIPAGGVTTTVERIYSGERSVVRGALRAPSVGGFTVTDYEAPMNVPVTYQATSYNTSGGAVSQSPISSSVTLVLTGVMYAWVSDPLSPALAVKAIMEAATAGELGYDAPTAVLAPMGRRYGIAVMGTRMAASGMPFTLYTPSNAEGETLRDLVTQAAPLCVRPATTNRLPALFYLASSRVAEKPYLGGPRVWDLSGDIVAPPSAAVAVPLHTYAELLAGYTSYAALDAAKATYLEVLRDPV